MNKKLKAIEILLVMLIFIFNSIGLNYVYANNIVASGNYGDNIQWTLDSEGTLTITGDGDMYNEQAAVSPWKDYKDQVKNVVFNGKITSISNRAFEEHTNLQSIILPDTIDTIGLRAFAECPILETVKMPKNLISIGMGAFYNCPLLKLIELPENVMYINEYVFDGCSSLKEITIKSELVSLYDTKNVLPDTLETIYGYQYSGAYYYARNNGVKFIDLKTNKTLTGTITNEDYLDILPTTGLGLGVIENGGSSDNPSIKFYNEKNTSNETYQEIKDIVDEITAGCTTQKEKARKVAEWVVKNISYGGVIGSTASEDFIYYVFNQRQARCGGYTMLTNYMLFLCDIPTATIKNLTHEWTAAYVDGEWIYIDTTSGLFGVCNSIVNNVTFIYNGMAYFINEPTEGIKELEQVIVSTSLKGDVNGDGKVNTTDVGMANAHAKNKKILTDEQFKRADVNNDGKVNTTDVGKINAYVKNKITL